MYPASRIRGGLHRVKIDPVEVHYVSCLWMTTTNELLHLFLFWWGGLTCCTPQPNLAPEPESFIARKTFPLDFVSPGVCVSEEMPTPMNCLHFRVK